MPQSDQPITSEVVTEEVLSQLEAMAEEGDSELGIFKVRRSKKNPARLVLTLDHGDRKQRFYLTCKEAT